MITFKAVVFAHQRHMDDSYNVKIRVTHKRRSKYISTTLTAYKPDLTKDLEIRRNTNLMFQCNREIERLTKTVAGIGYLVLDRMEIEDVMEYIDSHKEGFSLDFFVFADKWVDGKSEGARRVYVRSLNRFSEYLGNRECDINDITGTMARGFVEWYQKQPKMCSMKGELKTTKKLKAGCSTVRDTVQYLSAIHNAAKEVYNDDDTGEIRIPRSPFKKLKFDMVVRNGQDALSKEDMQALISTRLSNPRQQVFLDIFIISFALMGMNPADLFEAKNPKGDILIYNRKKTRSRRPDKAEMRVKLPDCLKERFARVGDKTNLISTRIKGNDPYSFSSKATHSIKHTSKSLFGREFTMYAARKTFASLARNECGVDKATVDECLVHITQDMKLADIYIKRDWNRLWEVQKKVLDLFEW